MRLARTHAASVSGDALFAIGLAGSVFFSLDFNSARWRVALYLILTIAPFAVAAPLIGPAIDRIKGGRRWIIVGAMAARAILCVLVVRHMGSVLFYPEAFGMLVVQKVYSISKSAVVPGTVRSDDELVEANSKLTVLSALAVVVAAVPGGILLKVGGGGWSVGLGALVYGVGTVLALQLTPTTVAAQPAGAAEKEELRSAGIVLAASAMGLIRGIVGFLSFMLAFSIKENGALWELGLVAVAAQLGFFCGAVAAPHVRRLATEERILVGALVVTCIGGFATAVIGGLFGAAILSLLVGATGSAAKQAFDAIVQRDAPDANRGRSFAKFETRFQLVWVIGALLPIVIPIPAEIGFAMVGVVAGFAVASYQIGQQRMRRGRMPVKRQLVRRRRRPAGPPPPASGPAPVPEDPTTVAPWMTDTSPATDRPEGAARRRAADRTGHRQSDPTQSSNPTANRSKGTDPTLAPPPAPTRPSRDVALTTSGPASSGDPARRWMRHDEPEGSDDSAQLPFDGGPNVAPAAVGAPGDQPALFDLDAWEDPLPPEDETPPFG